MATTIQIEEGIKKKLNSLREYDRETYNDIIKRLVERRGFKIDKESLIETIDVLSDPEMLNGIKEGLRDIEQGRIVELEQVKKEIGI